MMIPRDLLLELEEKEFKPSRYTNNNQQEVRHSVNLEVVYTQAERERILAEARCLERDGITTWSILTLRRALQQAPDRLQSVSSYTIWCVLKDAGWSWHGSRGWRDRG